MGRFFPFCTRIYTTFTSFLGYKKLPKVKNMMSCTRIYVKSTETLIDQGSKRNRLTKGEYLKRYDD